MSTTPPNSFLDEADRRYYLHPITGERWRSVTTFLDVVNKAALPYWYGKQASIAAVEMLPRLHAARWVPPCDDRSCYECLYCIAKQIQEAGNRERDAAADRGTRVHHVIEQYILTSGRIIPHEPDITDYIDQFLRFVDIHHVTFSAAEVTVVNRAHGYAGTLDAVLTCGWMPRKHVGLVGLPLIADWKTSNHIYETAGMQLGAYRRAETVMLPDGTEHPLPLADARTGLSVQLGRENFWVRPCDLDTGFQGFLHTQALTPIVERKIPEPVVGRAMTKPKTTPAATPQEVPA